MKRTRRRLTEDEKLAAYQWKLVVLTLDGEACRVTGSPLELECHHVLTQAHLRKHGHGDKLWDPRNGITLSKRVHARHTTAVERVPFWALRPDNLQFANELGLGWMLDKFYPRKAAA